MSMFSGQVRVYIPENPDFKGNVAFEEYYQELAENFSLKNDKKAGEMYFELEPMMDLPYEAAPLMIWATYQGSHPCRYGRETGRYVLGGATAEVHSYDDMQNRKIWIQAETDCLDDLYNLMRSLIKGDITPVESYETVQLGTSASQLASLVVALAEKNEVVMKGLESLLKSAGCLPVLPPAKNPSFLRPVTVF